MIGIVIAHHHDNLDFIEEWRSEFDREDVTIYICEDKNKHINKKPDWGKFKIFNHKDIEKDLKDKSWIIPFNSSAIKSYGFYKAWLDRCNITITIDNDCFPDQEDFILSHSNNLKKRCDDSWCKTTSVYTRGYPYGVRNYNKIAISHGVWSNIPDLDASTSLLNPDLRLPIETKNNFIPKGYFYPMSGMNLAFNTNITPIMYFGLHNKEWGYDRFDDIWAGLFSKKILDHLGYGVISGKPSVEHRKQSNVYENLIKEAEGIKLNEDLWKEINKIELTKINFFDCYLELIEKLPNINNYILNLKKATFEWLELFIHFKPFLFFTDKLNL